MKRVQLNAGAPARNDRRSRPDAVCAKLVALPPTRGEAVPSYTYFAALP